jgi:hypothetical protein
VRLSCHFTFSGKPEIIVVDFPPQKSYFRLGLVPSVLHATCSLTNSISSIYHMNISEKGNVCIDILKNNWSPALSIFKVVLSLSSLLTDPNPGLSLLPLIYVLLLISLISSFSRSIRYLCMRLRVNVAYMNHPVPSIATEFLRKRPMHDHIARQWTEMYAKPPPSPASPSAPSSQSSSSAGASPDTGRTSAKGKGRANAQSVDRDRAAEPETTGIDLTSEGVEATSYPTRGSKRQKDVHSTDGFIDLSEEVESNSTRSGKRRRVEQLGDVIVIDD